MRRCYEAHPFGVHSAMPMAGAHASARLVVVPPDFASTPRPRPGVRHASIPTRRSSSRSRSTRPSSTSRARRYSTALPSSRPDESGPRCAPRPADRERRRRHDEVATGVATDLPSPTASLRSRSAACASSSGPLRLAPVGSRPPERARLPRSGLRKFGRRGAARSHVPRGPGRGPDPGWANLAARIDPATSARHRGEDVAEDLRGRPRRESGPAVPHPRAGACRSARACGGRRELRARSIHLGVEFSGLQVSDTPGDARAALRRLIGDLAGGCAGLLGKVNAFHPAWPACTLSSSAGRAAQLGLFDGGGRDASAELSARCDRGKGRGRRRIARGPDRRARGSAYGWAVSRCPAACDPRFGSHP